MTDWYLGQQIFCVDDRPHKHAGKLLVQGQVYTIRDIIEDRLAGKTGFLLVGVTFFLFEDIEAAFVENRFRACRPTVIEGLLRLAEVDLTLSEAL